MSALLVACSTEKEPSTFKNQHYDQDTGTRFPVGLYENLYDTIKTRVIPSVMDLHDIRDVFDAVMHGYLDEDDIDSAFVAHIIEHNQDTILQLLEDAIDANDIQVDLEDNNLSWNAQYMGPVLSQMRDSVYITPSFRYNMIYTNFYLTEYEKFSLCLLAAINNTIYEEFFNNTVVIKDNYHELYYTIQLHPTSVLPIQWTRPWDIYEIEVADITLFNPADTEGYIAHYYGTYIPFHTHADRVYYLEVLDHGYDKYYVTSEECEEERDEAEDRLLTEIAFGLLLSAATAPEALPAASFVCLVYYEAQHMQIEKRYSDCLESVDDEE